MKPSHKKNPDNTPGQEPIPVGSPITKGPVVVTEGISGSWHYHLSKTGPGEFVTGLCGARTMQTQLPVSSWGIRGHLREKYCQECVRLAGLEKTFGETPEVVFTGSERDKDRAIEAAEKTLGAKVGECSDGRVNFKKAGYCRIEWIGGLDEAKAPGLPSISLPRKFQWVKAP